VILAAAREAFADRGFDGTSIRAIAAAAGVDPALVHHYFGTKDQLFLDAMQVPVDPAAAITSALAGGRDGAGERLLRTMLMVWDSPLGTAAAAMVRSAVSNETFARLLREFIKRRIMRRIAAQLDLDPAEADLRTTLAASQIAGLIMVRYLIRLEPLASLPAPIVAALVGPNVQRYLTGDLPALATLAQTTPAEAARDAEAVARAVRPASGKRTAKAERPAKAAGRGGGEPAPTGARSAKAERGGGEPAPTAARSSKAERGGGEPAPTAARSSKAERGGGEPAPTGAARTSGGRGGGMRKNSAGGS
jgi:AcrR family transcriptional regulator